MVKIWGQPDVGRMLKIFAMMRMYCMALYKFRGDGVMLKVTLLCGMRCVLGMFLSRAGQCAEGVVICRASGLLPSLGGAQRKGMHSGFEILETFVSFFWGYKRDLRIL